MLFLATLRHQARRFVAPGVAVVLGVAFVAATLILGDALSSSVQRGMAGDLAGYAAVVTPRDDRPDALTLASADTARAVPGVTGVRTVRWGALDGGDTAYAAITSLPRLGGNAKLTAGRLPSTATEVAVDPVYAAAHGVGVGDTTRLRAPGTSSTGAGTAQPVTATVVGIIDARANPRLNGVQAVFALDPTITTVTVSDVVRELDVEATGDLDAVRAALRERLGDVRVQSGPEAVADQVAGAKQGATVITTFLLGFAAVALFVCAIVVANTFTILLARRARETALLRCVGATRGQVIRSTLAESTALGLVFSVLGTAVGYGLAAAAVAIGGRFGSGIFSVLALDTRVVSLVMPVVVGTVVMVVSSIRPVLRASRVAPLAALHPDAAVGLGSRRGRVRIGMGLGLVALGAGLLVLTWTKGSVWVGIAGGLVSFLGVLLAASVIVPWVAALVGRPLARLTGVPGQLALDNALRNPGRAASTATALLVGVTLIVMTFVGAATSSASINGALDKEFAVDLSVTAGPQPLTDAVRRDLAAVPGVVSTGAVPGAVVTLDPGSGRHTSELAIVTLPSTLGSVLRNPAPAATPAPGTLVVASANPDLGLTNGAQVRLVGPLGSRTFTVAVRDHATFAYAVAPADFAALTATPTTAAVLMRLSDDAAVTDALVATTKIARGADATVGGAAPQRAQLSDVLKVVTFIISGLLALSVLIALVGIGNTLALSVHERRRENALLRALGVTRGQIRSMLALEGGLLALVGAVLGVALGVAYGLAGARGILAGAHIAVNGQAPVGALAIIAVGAVGAGLVASALPGRRAARVAPAAVLAID